ncbi:vitamin B12 ABC transporter permease BtuC [Plesiomonas shigelloides]|uniref:vitamin B12 ABC transporter permease BtuC n=1 Tax=Plesiomonas shigelloides TaxID=703 RepID=UPI001261E0F4|nr:vitamin B12 ABC transporter permease BtuC [Plesiomonas shigelloides]KAB7714986.1 vitamin B12 ABC transporter permease BtuC [Plesiomonas shigelloides]
MPFYQLVLAQQQRCRRRLGYMALLVVALFLFSLAAGEQWVTLQNWHDPMTEMLVFQLRLPRLIVACLTGAALATAGAAMQNLFANPLAEPGLLGLSNGSGVLLVFAMWAYQGFPPLWLVSVLAITGALISTLFLLWLAHYRQLNNARLLLMGVALSILSGALMTWMVYLSDDLSLRQLMYWMMGSFSGISWSQLWLLPLLVIPLLWLLSRGQVFNLLMLGDTAARQLGLNTRVLRIMLVLAVAVIIGSSVALAGIISFVGLIVPHLLRLGGFTDQRYLLPACGLCGAAAMMLADLVARLSLNAAELPVGVVTASIGAPLFVWMLLRHVTGD